MSREVTISVQNYNSLKDFVDLQFSQQGNFMRSMVDIHGLFRLTMILSLDGKKWVWRVRIGGSWAYFSEHPTAKAIRIRKFRD